MNEKEKDSKYYAPESGTRNDIKYQDKTDSSLSLKDITEVTQTVMPKKKRKYTLEKDGSGIEEKSWKLFIRKQFPKYEDYWLKFVVPRTNRPKDIGMKDGLELIEQKLVSFHYSIIHNLYYVKRNLRLRKNFNREIFEICYVRLSSAIDNCESFLFWFLILNESKDPNEKIIDKTLLDIINQLFDSEERKKEIDKINKTKNYLKNEFNKDLAPRFSLLSKKDLILHLVKKKGFEIIIKDFYKLIEDIRKYRNIIIHSLPLMEINSKFPKREFVSSLKDWLEIDRQLRNNEKNVLSKFDEMKNIITLDFDEFLKQINNLWGKIVI